MNRLGNMEIRIMQLLVCHFKSHISLSLLSKTCTTNAFFFINISGYKLAFNYLKAKKYIDAIDVCHKVTGRSSVMSHSLLSLSLICLSHHRFWPLIPITRK